MAADWPSAMPLVMTMVLLFAWPSIATRLQSKGWGSHLLGARAVALIEQGLVECPT